jgi:glyoxylase-like metal-dependent hydrolase (beta-lactamase superfamily II)
MPIVRHLVILVFSVLTFGLLSQTSIGHAAQILDEPNQVSNHVYAWIGPLDGANEENQGYRINLAFVVGTSGVAVFDTGCTSQMAKEMVAHIAKITPLPIKYAINSNSQPHWHFGNDVFHAAGATIITSEEEAERMNDMGGMFAQFVDQATGKAAAAIKAPNAPVEKLDEPKTLDLGGGVTLKVKTVGATHTPNSLIAGMPSDKVVLAGDVLYNGRLLAILDISHTGDWIKAYDGLRKYKGCTFVLGHGEPAPLSAFEWPTYSYLTGIWTHMLKALKTGHGADKAVKSFYQSAYAKLVNFEELAGRNASWASQQAEFASF